MKRKSSPTAESVKLSRLDLIALSAHMSSGDIGRRRAILLFKMESLETEISEVRSKLSTLLTAQAENLANLRGLSSVVEGRNTR